MNERLFGQIVQVACASALALGAAAHGQVPAPETVGLSPAAAAGQLSDLAIVERDFLAVDRSYSPQSRARAQHMLAQLRRVAGRLSAAQFELRLAEVAAAADNGHTTVFMPPWKSRYNKVPVRFGVFSDGLYVTDADAAHRDVVGAKVVSVEGKGLPALRNQLHHYMAAAQGFRDEYLPIWLQSPELMHASGIGARPDRLAVELVRDGRQQKLVLRANPPGGEIDQAYSAPSQLIELTKRLPESRKPIYLRQSDALFQLLPMARDAYYLQFRSNRGDTIAPFASHALDVLVAERPRFIILDERLNAGGDLGSTRDLMQALGPIVGPTGHVFILTSGRTFSAGIASVAYAKQAAGPRATIIGEPVGDRLEFWSEGSPTELPYSKVLIQPSPQRHNYTNGCPEADCHASIHAHPLFVSSVAPDVRAGLTYDDFVSGRDPALSAAMQMMEQQRRKR